MRFRVEEARVRLFQGESAKAIQLLNGEWSHAPVDRNLPIDRLIILSLAQARMGNVAQANESMKAAVTLCSCEVDSSNMQMRGNILSAKGSLALQENDFINARTDFVKSLEIARADSDRYLEARMRLNLSVIDLLEDHYEDALEQSQVASDIARRIGAQLIVVGAQGNSGWAFYETGDYTRALACFNDAAEAAADLGAPFDEEHWLDTAGMSEAQLGNLDAARESYGRSLSLAKSLQNGSEITQVDQALASLFLHSSHPDEAERYIDEARLLARRDGSEFDIQIGNLLEGQFLAQSGDRVQAQRAADKGRATNSPIPYAST